MHPMAWTRPVSPGDLRSETVAVVKGGARAAGGRADALVVGDSAEQSRRAACGLAAITSLGLLDAIMNLPAHWPVPTADMSAETLARLAAIPEGVVEVAEGRITRILTPPLTVVAVLIRGVRGRLPISRAANFAAFAQQIVVLDREPARGPALLWEAQLAGIGVWVARDGRLTELLPPEPFALRYWKPAGWRFAERAYGTQVTASDQRASHGVAADRRSRRGTEALDPLELSLPAG